MSSSWDIRPVPSAQRRRRQLWAFAAGLLVVLVAVAVAAYYVVRPASTRDAGRIVGYTPPKTAGTSGSSTTSARGLAVSLLRGGRTGCVTTGGCNDDNYDARLTYLEGWIITTDASGGTGYVAGNVQRPRVDFGARLPDVIRLKPKVVIVEGSVSDMRYSYEMINRAAITLYETLRTDLADAKVIVIGPMWGGSAPPRSVVAVERALRAASTGRVAKFIDPIAENWFGGANAALMGPDHVTPTNEGHRLIAQRIANDLSGINLVEGA